MAPLRIQEHFATLEEPRVDRTRRHDLAEILVIAVLAVLAGADGWEDTEVWAKARQSWLKIFLVLSSGVPCPDTFRRVFRAGDPTKLAACFASMTAELAGSMLDQLVAIDGKTMRQQSDPRMSVKMKRRRVGWDNDYLFTVLAAVTSPTSSS